MHSFYFLTLFPEIFDGVLNSSLLGKAQGKGLVEFHLTQIRDFSKDSHRTVDDAPYGGGEGMLLRVDVLHAAHESALKKIQQKNGTSFRKTKTILMSPQGEKLTQEKAKSLAEEVDDFVIVCGHYEGVDERFIELCVDEEISIGDYVLTGGELPAMVLADTLCRLWPDVLGNPLSASKDSLEGGLLKYPQYTRPPSFQGREIPQVLLSGNHAEIEKWRALQAQERTKEKRPDLWERFLAQKKPSS